MIDRATTDAIRWTPERLRRAGDLMQAALRRAPDARPAFLARACADDAVLRRATQALLADYDARDGTSNETSDGTSDRASDEASGGTSDGASRPATAVRRVPQVGARVGPYRLAAKLGRGGMGTVFRAERADGQFAQQVAIKILHADTHPDFGRRFRTERQILASLDHPHIARLLDGGVLDAGGPRETPYLVMEYVDGGEPLTTYCDRRALSVDERLALFEQVCHAVQHAHGKLVVHRDLKPTNILVATDEDGHPQVKLLDFGIAKLLDARLLAPDLSVIETEGGPCPMTPAYAAPEQLLNQPVTVATDVYQLGTVLFELLVGRRPFEGEGWSMHRKALAVVEEEATDLSTALTAQAEADLVARARGASSASALARALRGDLNVLCLTALRKEPERRYASPAALASDIHRYRQGLPLAAQPDTAGYRLRTFVRRHRALVTALATAFVALTVGFGAALWQAGVAATERDRARQEAAKAEEVNRFLVGLFDASDPYATEAVRGDTLTARTLLRRGEARLRDDLADQPAVRANLQAQIGVVYRRLGLLPPARTVLDEAVATLRALPDPPPRDLGRALSKLARVAREEGDFEAAEALQREAIDRLQAAPDVPPDEHAGALTDLALVLADRGRFEEAEALARRSLAEQEALPEAPPDLHASTLNLLGDVLRRQGRYDEAEDALRQALRATRAHYGDRHPATAKALNDLATVAFDTGAPETAEDYFRQALAVQRATLGDAHPETVTSLHNVAAALNEQERYAEAAPLVREAMTTTERRLGPNHPSLAEYVGTLAFALEGQERYAEAAPLYRRALAITEAALAPGHPDVGFRLHGLARVTRLLGRYAEAEALDRRSVEIFRNALGPEHPFTAITQGALGVSLMRLRRYAEAEPLLVASYAQLDSTLGPDHAHTQRAAGRLDELRAQRVP